ncbi:5'-nucleotidase SurE [Carex littledalei]|uniref:5'-nucleotidase SurE n=1 Tax=Carex littledalei TaxID=544730 RepID=A0A833QSD4_9POAL|nr:5'-nucleotidase SurE [Carex littledalei]
MTMSSDSDPPKLPQFVPQSLVSDLQSALLSRRAASTPPEATSDEPTSEEAKGGEVTASPVEESPGVESSSADVAQSVSETKPIVLVTCADGINSAGLEFLVTALVSTGQYDVSVCAPESGKFASGDSITIGETVVATSTEVSGAKAFQVSGTPVDCVSLALSAALFSWSKPALVISGINKGSSCGHESFHSGAVAGAKEALMCGIPAIAISLKWKKNESQDTDLKDAVNVSMPLIQAAIRDVEKGQFPKSCFLNIGIPASPSINKGVRITKQSEWRPMLSWQATSANRPPSVAPQFLAMHQSLGLQLAQLGRDASAAGAARRANAQRKNIEVESVASAGKPETKEVVKKLFRLELVEKQQDEGLDGGLDYVALENGFISVTPLDVQLRMHPEIQVSASDWLTSILKGDEED